MTDDRPPYFTRRKPEKRSTGILDQMLAGLFEPSGRAMTTSAVRHLAEAEGWALAELKRRLDALDEAPQNTARHESESATPAAILAGLLQRSSNMDPAAARHELYRQALSQLVPDQIAMLDTLSTRRLAPLCHLGASRWPFGRIRVHVLTHASTLGREAGILLQEHASNYMAQLFALGLLREFPEEKSLENEYELLLADTEFRAAQEYIRRELRMFSRLSRAAVGLSDYGQTLWRECRPAAEAIVDPGQPAS